MTSRRLHWRRHRRRSAACCRQLDRLTSTSVSTDTSLNDKQPVKSITTTTNVHGTSTATTNGSSARLLLLLEQLDGRGATWHIISQPRVAAMAPRWHRASRKTPRHRRNLTEQANIAARTTRLWTFRLTARARRFGR